MTFFWNADPELIRLGSLAIRWYGLLYALSFLFGTLLMSWMFRRENKPPETIDRLLIYMLVAVVVGARLGETLFYHPSFFFQHPLEIFKVWKGGLSSHGGVIGILLALYIYSRKTPDQSFLWILDRICLVVALGGTLIRIGNFFNSEIIGIPTHSNWGVVFQRIDNLPRHPAQLYESATYFILFLILITVYRSVDTTKYKGILAGLFLSIGFTSRFFIEFVKENLVFRDSEVILNMGQRLSIPVILLGLFLLARLAWKKNQ